MMSIKKQKFVERAIIVAILCIIGFAIFAAKYLIRDTFAFSINADVARYLATSSNQQKIDTEAGRQQLVDVLTKVREQAKMGKMSLTYDYSADIESWEAYTKEKLRARNFKLASDFRSQKELDFLDKEDIVYWGTGTPETYGK